MENLRTHPNVPGVDQSDRIVPVNLRQSGRDVDFQTGAQITLLASLGRGRMLARHGL